MLRFLKKLRIEYLKFLSKIYQVFIISISYPFIKEKIKLIRNNNYRLSKYKNFYSLSNEIDNILSNNQISDQFSIDYWGKKKFTTISPLLAFVKEKYLNPKNIIEIGTGYGKTSLHIKKIFNNSSIITLEPPKTFIGSHWSKKNNDHTKVVGLLNSNNISTYEGTTDDFQNTDLYKKLFAEPNNKELIIFVDGDHNVPGLSFDYVYLRNLLKNYKGKILIIFDDYYPKNLTKIHEFFNIINPEFFDKTIGIDVYRISNSLEKEFNLDGISFFRDKDAAENNYSLYTSYFNCFRILKNF